MKLKRIQNILFPLFHGNFSWTAKIDEASPSDVGTFFFRSSIINFLNVFGFFIFSFSCFMLFRWSISSSLCLKYLCPWLMINSYREMFPKFLHGIWWNSNILVLFLEYFLNFAMKLIKLLISTGSLLKYFTITITSNPFLATSSPTSRSSNFQAEKRMSSLFVILSLCSFRIS